MEGFPCLHCFLLQLDRVVVSELMRGLDDEQVFDVSELALYSGNNIGAAAGDTETFVRIDVPWN